MIKCVPHVQHDCFSSFNQSDHFFLVSSLPLPSSLRKLPIVVLGRSYVMSYNFSYTVVRWCEPTRGGDSIFEFFYENLIDHSHFKLADKYKGL